MDFNAILDLSKVSANFFNKTDKNVNESDICFACRNSTSFEKKTTNVPGGLRKASN